MGLEIKRNKKGLFQLKSSVDDNLIHDEKWITEDEAKAALIERAYWDFIRSVIEIDMEFPNEYHVNGKRHIDEKTFLSGKKFVLNNWNKPDVVLEKFKEICEKLKVEL